MFWRNHLDRGTRNVIWKKFEICLGIGMSNTLWLFVRHSSRVRHRIWHRWLIIRMNWSRCSWLITRCRLVVGSCYWTCGSYKWWPMLLISNKLCLSVFEATEQFLLWTPVCDLGLMILSKVTQNQRLPCRLCLRYRCCVLCESSWTDLYL